MPVSSRTLQWLLVVAALAWLLLFTLGGTARPVATWQWLDIAGEGGTAAMAGLWAWLVLASRPGGRVTGWLAGGLAAVMLGAWADCLDEVFAVSDAFAGLKWIESTLTPLGMVALTVGLLLWRQEQAVLSEHLVKRERLFRDHRAFDRVTQVANAAYLRRQLELEAARGGGPGCALALIELEGYAAIERERGRAEADRVLQGAAHQLLLNVRHRDLVCRYAGHRFVVLMPDTPLSDAQHRAAHLARMVSAMSLHARDGDRPLPLAARAVCAAAGTDPAALMAELNLALEGACLRTVPAAGPA
jgi:diguanylate cyclase (GGDEF)-like protein